MRSPLEVLSRLVVVTALVLWISHVVELPLVRSMLPMLRFMLQHEQTDFVIRSVDITYQSPDNNFRVRGNLAHPQEVGGRMFFPIGDGTAFIGGYQATMTLGGVVIYSVMLLITVLTWPVTTWREWRRRMVWTIPLMLTLIAGNIAITMPAQLWFPIHDAWVPDVPWTLLETSRLLMGGAGLIIAVVLGIMVILIGQRSSISDT